MANIVLFSTIAIVVPLSVFCERRNSLLNSNTLHQTVPHQFNHDQKELNRNGNDLDKDPWQSGREVRVGPRSPPLPPEHPAPWSFSAYQKQLQVGKVSLNRVHELENKLTLNKIMPIQRRNKPLQNTHFNLKSPENKRIKREVDQIEDNIREKREVLINSKIMPEVIMQPRIQPALTQEAEARYQEKVIEKKRDKRQILLMIKQQPLMFGKKSRTTPNPFIPETNIADYDIVKPDTYKPEVEIVESMDTDSYQLRAPQSLFQYLQSLIFNFGQKQNTELLPDDKDINEDFHIRVKRRMTKFVRDKKQMNRKKKIGRKKKTKVRRASIKLKKWYHSRQKVKKKGDGTYRGGRGRKPRQHKKPKFYKQVQNDTSDYDYYDDDGNIREASGETQEGSDDAAYVSYGTGEYADTAEAEAAHQNLEKEYQMQLVKRRRKEEKKRLSNGTYVSSEESLPPPYVSSEEDKSNKTNDGEEEYEYYDDDEEDGDEYESETNEESSNGDSNGDGGKNNKNHGKSSKNENSNDKEKQRKLSQLNQETKHILTVNSDKQHGKYYVDKTAENNNILQHMLLSHTQTRNKHTTTDNKKKLSNDIRITAKKLNIMSQAALPGFKNAITQNQPSNWISAVKFGVPRGRMIKDIQSMPLKKIPDVNSITNPGLTSFGGQNMQNLQSKKLNRVLESTSHDKNLGLTSIVKDKSENAHIYTSKTRDKRKGITSLGNGGMKHVLSITRDIGLTSIARHIPDLEIDSIEVNDLVTKKTAHGESEPEDIKTSPKANKPQNNHQALPIDTRRNEAKIIKRTNNKNKPLKSPNKLQKRETESYEDESFVPNENHESFVPDEDQGLSAPSDEIEEAP